MRTNDGTLDKQLWLWDFPSGSDDNWENMRDTIFSNEDPQPVADDLSDGYIADRMYWDTQDSTPQLLCDPAVLESQPKPQDYGPTPDASPTAEQSSDISISAFELPETISIVD